MTSATILSKRETLWLWVTGFGAAFILLLLIAGKVAGSDPAKPETTTPARLPATVHLVAEPLPGMHRATPAWDGVSAGDPTMDLVRMVWTVMEDHRHGDFEAALEGWNSVQLDYDTDFWRLVAIGQAHLAMGNVEGATYALTTADEIAPDNAVVHYYLGLLRLAEAQEAFDWYDALGPSRTRLVSFVPRDVVPNSRSMYLLAACTELERAIVLAPMIRLDEPLTPDAWHTTIALGPTVGDLLLAIGAENFAAKAHNMLAPILLEQGALDAAETHLDAAVRGGVFVGFGYVDLIDAYEENRRHVDAARVCAKAVDHGLDERAAQNRAVAILQRYLAR